MYLFIAEKPSLGRAIAEVIGIKSKKSSYIECKNNTVVTWCFGHILELAKPDQYIKSDDKKPRWKAEDLPIIPNRWVKYIKKDAKQQFNTIKSLTSKADTIVNAGDPDREGQLLVDEVIEYLKVKKPVKRIWLQALDRENILKALNSIEDNRKYLPYKLSAEARSYADWLVGMNFTRYFTLKANTLITVGRVQTPTLALVVQRDEQIENFKPHDYFMLYAHLPFKATFKPDENLNGLDEENRLIDENTAKRIVKETTAQNATVTSFKRTIKKESPPMPFMLSSLQKYLSGKMSLTAQQTLSTIQELYEKKLVTYPRTDCPYIAEEQFKDAKKILSNISKTGILPDLISSADFKIKHKAFNSSKITAHTAIIPTGDVSGLSALNMTQKRVFEEIVKAYACLFQKPYEYYSATIEVDIKNYRFTATLKQTIDEGYRKHCGDKVKSVTIPNLKKGSTLFNKQTTIEIKQTTPPARFTDGTLIDAMSHIHKYIDNKDAKAVLKENDGIGTEATRAAIIEQLVKRGYIQRKGKQLISTPMAREFIKQLPDFIKDPVLTARWERGLAGILNGEVTFEKFLNAQIDFLKKEIKKDVDIKVTNTNNGNSNGKTQKKGRKCPDCGNPMAKLKTKTGKNYYWCGKCKSAYWIDKGGKVGKKWSFN